MEWKEINPQQNNWKKQWDLTAYYGEHVIGSIVLDNDNWGVFYSVIDGDVEFIPTSDLEEAKGIFYESLDCFFEGEINYYNELRKMLGEIN